MYQYHGTRYLRAVTILTLVVASLLNLSKHVGTRTLPWTRSFSNRRSSHSWTFSKYIGSNTYSKQFWRCLGCKTSWQRASTKIKPLRRLLFVWTRWRRQKRRKIKPQDWTLEVDEVTRRGILSHPSSLTRLRQHRQTRIWRRWVLMRALCR